MKFGLMLFVFFIASSFLIFITIERHAEAIYSAQIHKIKRSKIQVSSAKTYRRTRKVYVPKRSFVLANKEINDILLKEPSLSKFTLMKLVKVVNNVKEDVVLSIAAHTDFNGTAKQNLDLSQKRADLLKEYFRSKTNLPLVVAIGYGKIFSLENRLVKINLKRIKQ